MQMATYMKETGKIAKRMAMEYSYTIMAENTKDIGKTICNTGMALKPGQMEINIKDNINLVKKMEKELINGMMEAFIKGIG